VTKSSSPSPRKKKDERLVIAAVLGLLGLFLFLSLSHRILVIVPAGHTGVLWRLHGGTVTDQQYPEGLHVLSPWNEMALYNTRLQSETREFQAQALGGLSVTTTITFRYRPIPQKLPILHKEIGKDYVDQYIAPELGALLASHVATKDHDSIYADRSGLAKELIDQIRDGKALRTPLTNGEYEQLVDIPELFVTDVKLPKDVDDVVKSKFAKIERLEAAEYDRLLVDLDNELLEREGKGVALFQKIIGDGLEPYLHWKSIEAARDAAKSNNSKVVILGPGVSAPVLVDSNP
jgi:regulator of protease activity HflC (stomatin/prohibitin superfamily)